MNPLSKQDHSSTWYGRRLAALLAVLAVAATSLVIGASSPAGARTVARAASGHSTVKPATDPPSARIAAVIAKAKGETGKGLSYSWGGGGKNGPSYGVCCSPSGVNDSHTYGFDCSGLTQFAFWQGAGIDIGTTSTQQSQRGTRVSWANRRAGDLVLWYTSSGSADHVAILINKTQIVESAAPRNSTSVHVTNVYGSHATVQRIISG